MQLCSGRMECGKKMLEIEQRHVSGQEIGDDLGLLPGSADKFIGKYDILKLEEQISSQ